MLHLLLLFEIAFVFISDIGYESCYCTAFDADKVCTSCIDGYVLNLENKCVFFEDAHCSSNIKTTDERCSACASEYVLTPEKNCIDCSYQHLDCTTISGTDCSVNCTKCGVFTYINNDK